MRLTDISIRNYRQYQNLEFHFPQHGDHDLHVIVAKNGIGKTNILNAINWCLYGDEPHLGDSSKSLPMINLEERKKLLSEGKGSGSIEVTIRAEDNDMSFSYTRTLQVKLNPYYENKNKSRFVVSKISRSGDVETVEGEEADRYVELYMPYKIRQYFYFDGEQLHNYFTKNNNVNIKENIHAISQVDIVTRVKTHLSLVIKNKERDPGVQDDDLIHLKQEKDDVETRINDHEEHIKTLNESIEKSNEIIQRNGEYLRGKENIPELETKRDALINKRSWLEEERVTLKSEFAQFIRDYKIIFSFYKPAEKVLGIITDKENKKQLPPTIDRGLLEGMIKNHKCSICEHDLTPEDEERISKVIEQIQVSSATSHTLKEIKSELSRVIDEAENYPKKKGNILLKIRNNEERLSETERDLQSIDNTINAVTDREDITNMFQEMTGHEKLRSDNYKKLGVYESELKKLRNDFADLQNKYDKCLEKNKATKRLSQQLMFARKALGVIKEIEQEMMHEVRNELAVTTSEYFSRLVWKKNTYGGVSLNDNYELNLTHKDGYPCIGSCSAAERALLALSFTLALHRVSGRESLLFIDTPVARVSDVNRNNFAKVLSEVSREKQIIMTFTPDEYSNDISSVFDPISASDAELSTVGEDKTVIYHKDR